MQHIRKSEERDPIHHFPFFSASLSTVTLMKKVASNDEDYFFAIGIAYIHQRYRLRFLTSKATYIDKAPKDRGNSCSEVPTEYQESRYKLAGLLQCIYD